MGTVPGLRGDLPTIQVAWHVSKFHRNVELRPCWRKPNVPERREPMSSAVWRHDGRVLQCIAQLLRDPNVVRVAKQKIHPQWKQQVAVRAEESTGDIDSKMGSRLQRSGTSDLVREQPPPPVLRHHGAPPARGATDIARTY